MKYVAKSLHRAVEALPANNENWSSFGGTIVPTATIPAVIMADILVFRSTFTVAPNCFCVDGLKQLVWEEKTRNLD
jgi:hypothetical protein